LLSTPPTRSHIRGANRQTMLLLTLAATSLVGLMLTVLGH